jgi:hypothetical protein
MGQRWMYALDGRYFGLKERDGIHDTTNGAHVHNGALRLLGGHDGSYCLDQSNRGYDVSLERVLDSFDGKVQYGTCM